jgi:hypothetical protein
MGNGAVGAVECGAMIVELFDVAGSDDATAIVDSIEADRPHYTVRPGLVRKFLPLAIDATTGNVTSGGAYLFDSLENAQAYLRWTGEEYRVEGLLFHERPFVANLSCFIGPVVGAHDFDSFETAQASIRIQLWQAPLHQAHRIARAAWSALKAAAGELGLSGIWLAVEPDTDRIALITVIRRTESVGGDDYDAWNRLGTERSPGKMLSNNTALKSVHDACMWIFTIWQPARNGIRQLGLWPNSPPLPSPAYDGSAR